MLKLLFATNLVCFQNFQKDGTLSGGTGSSGQRQFVAKDMGNKRISHQTHDTVSQIFKLISDKDTKQQGLQKLYDFKVSFERRTDSNLILMIFFVAATKSRHRLEYFPAGSKRNFP